MHPEIASWPAETFYEGLRNGKATETFQRVAYLVNQVPMPNANTPVCVVDHDHWEENDEEVDSIANPGEAGIVHDIVVSVRRSGWADVGVIAPYASHAQCLGKLFDEEEKPEIHSIDKHQGREKDVIILSMVRSNSSGDVV